MQGLMTNSQRMVMKYMENDWAEGEAPLLVHGAAGTGKTWMIGQLVGDRRAAYLSITGKAVGVLRSKVNDPEGIFSTLHGALYWPVCSDQERHDRLTAELDDAKEPDDIRRLLAELESIPVRWGLRPCFPWDLSEEESECGMYFGERKSSVDVIVIDECSMVPEEMGFDLMRLAGNTPVIAVGDFHQLPPVNAVSYFRPERCFEAPELTDIVRQAAGNPIIDLAWRIRNGGKPYLVEAPGLLVTHKGTQAMEPIDQILVGTHKTRHQHNAGWRSYKGLQGDLVLGERLMVTKNDHTRKIYNGDQFVVEQIDGELVLGRFADGRGLWLEPQNEDHMKERGIRPRRSATPVVYGYACTVHKFQGSEAGHCLAIDESYCFRENAGRWLYTAVTRARQSLTLHI
jgi:exodeoxyribonuclease V